MNWDDLRIFLSLARTGRLSETGRQLRIDHSTVGRRVKSLEKTMGRKLFVRNPRGYQVTLAGEELVSFAETVEATIISAESKVVDKSEQLTGQVRIACPEGIAAFGVAGAAQKLCETHPKLNIQLLTNAQKYSLSKREADVLISVSKPETGRLKIQKITDVSLHLYATKTFLESCPTIKNKSDLHDLRFVSYVPELLPEKELNYLPLFDANLDAQLTATSVHVQSAAILNGAGIGIMHDFMAVNHANLIKILPDEVSIQRTLWMIVHQDYSEVERIKTVSKEVVSQIRKMLADL